jgi:hypothetical protein
MYPQVVLGDRPYDGLAPLKGSNPHFTPTSNVLLNQYKATPAVSDVVTLEDGKYYFVQTTPGLFGFPATAFMIADTPQKAAGVNLTNFSMAIPVSGITLRAKSPWLYLAFVSAVDQQRFIVRELTLKI